MARLLWLAPLLLLFIGIYLSRAALEQRTTWQEGQPAQADVLEVEVSNRVDVTLDYVSLKVDMPDGSVLVKEKMSMPSTLMRRLEDARTLDVHVRPGSSQEVIIDKLMPAQWLITAGNAGMSLLGALLLSIGVFAWNRYLKRRASAPEEVAGT